MKTSQPCRSVGRILLLSALVFSLAACGGPSQYVLHLMPVPAGELGPSTTFTVGILPFTDSRPSPQVLGKRILNNGKEEKILLDSPSAAQDVTYILRRSLTARGVHVVDLSSWTPDPAHLKDLPQDVDVAVAGHIDALAVEARSSLVDTKLKYRVTLSAQIGFKKEGTVVTRSVEITPEETVLSFDPLKVEEHLNRSLADALGRLVEIVFSPAPHGQ